jgi:putative flippase GtrA
MLKKLTQHRGMRYLFVGGSVYILEVIIIIALQRAGASGVQAVAISFTVGLVVSFLLQKLFTFRDKRMAHRIVLTQALAVIALVVFNFGFTVAMTKIFEQMVSPVIIRTVALGMTTIWNFYLYRTRIFTPSNNPDRTSE